VAASIFALFMGRRKPGLALYVSYGAGLGQYFIIILQWINALVNGVDVESELLNVQKINECTDNHTMIDLMTVDKILRDQNYFKIFFTSVPMALFVTMGLLSARFAALELMRLNSLKNDILGEEMTGRDGIEIHIATDKNKMPSSAESPRSKIRGPTSVNKSDSTAPVIAESSRTDR
jgi:hypothetical protein